MAVELAVAYVSIIPSTKGLAAQMRKEVGAPLESITAKAGIVGGQGFMSNFASNVAGGMDSLGGSIVDGVSRWTRRAGLVGAGILGAGLFGGLQRVLDTEDATILFRQMGLSVEDIDKALKGVDRTFNGTPFANPDGFNISAQLLSSGRELGDIEDDLRGIANVTAQTLDKDLHRTADTFLRIAATGRAYAVDLNSLALQGIPMRQILAEGLNVSADALADMVTEGEITFDVMMDIINATERFDGAAQGMGSSTRGAFQNVLTGVKRVGESFLGPLFGENGYAVQGFLAIRQALFDVTPAADRLGKRFAAWLVPQVRNLVRWFDDELVPAVKSVIGWFGRNRDAIARFVRAAGPAVGIVAGLAVSINLVRRAFALTPLGVMFAIATALVSLYQNSDTFRDVVDRLAGALTTIVTGAFTTLSAWWKENGPRVIELATGLGNAFLLVILPGITGVANFIGTDLLPALGEISTWILQNDPVLAGLAAAMGVIMVRQIGLWIIATWRLIAALAAQTVAVTLAYWPLILITVAIAALTTGVVYAYQEWDWFRGIVDGSLGVLRSARDILQTIWQWLDKITTAAANAGAALGGIKIPGMPNIPGASGPLGWLGDITARGFVGLIPGVGHVSKVKDLIDALPFGDSGGVWPGRRGEHTLGWVAGGETLIPTHKPGVTIPTQMGVYGPGAGHELRVVVDGTDRDLVRMVLKMLRVDGAAARQLQTAITR